VNPTLSSIPFIFLEECFHCHFLQLPSYCRRVTSDLYLLRDSNRLRARSYFLSAGKTAAPRSGFRGHPVLSALTPQCVTRGFIRLDSSPPK